MRLDVTIVVRILGLMALLWTNWQVAIVAMLLLGFTLMPKGEPTLTVKVAVRFAVEIGVYVLAMIGIWYFPLIDSEIAHMLVYLAVILSVLSFVINLRKDLNKDYNEECIKYLKYHPLKPK